MANDNSIPSTQSTGALAAGEYKKMLIPIAITLLVNFGINYIAREQSQAELQFETKANKEAIAVNAANVKANSDALNQIVISMARFSEAQSRIAQDLKQLQDDQRYNNQRMNQK